MSLNKKVFGFYQSQEKEVESRENFIQKIIEYEGTYFELIKEKIHFIDFKNFL